MARQRATGGDKRQIAESGDIWFFYRPLVGEERPGGLEDIYPFYLVLKPQARELWRLLVVGRKRLPDPERHERHWGYVDKVAARAEDIEGELKGAMPGEGGRKVEAARPAGEGVYAIVRRHGDMHLAYALELPKRPGPPQRALGIAEEGVMVLVVKNPKAKSPKGTGLPAEEKADYPPDLLEEFGGRRFAGDDPHLLDYEGAEFVLIGASTNVAGDLEVRLLTEDERLETSELVATLKAGRASHPVGALLRGEWE